MPAGRCDVANGAMEVLVVVPGDECGDPVASRGDCIEGLARIARAVLQRAEQGLRERVVVADAGAAERGDHAETLQGGAHG